MYCATLPSSGLSVNDMHSNCEGSLDDTLVISLVEYSSQKTSGGIGYKENQMKAHDLLYKVEEQFLFKD